MSTVKAKATKTVENAVEAGKEQFEQVYKASTEAATKGFEKTFEMSKKQMDEAVKGFDDITSFSKDNVEAVIASGTACAKGVEALSAEFAAYSKKSVEDSIAAAKALSGAKNLRELYDMQNALVKDSYDSFVAESGRLSELTTKFFGEMFEPVNARVANAMEQFVRPAR